MDRMLIDLARQVWVERAVALDGRMIDPARRVWVEWAVALD